ncbi:hypothetical protein [Variovorax sp. M-6]|uniref:hypothetical protein n=1 Tax=Variovorax sp. M-6 TaxID=3233041 RepID=UPI003F99F479
MGVATILWITLTQIAASGMGGYLAGRLRTKWAGVHTDEVYFRDTAHGFLAWGVATLVTAAVLTSVIGSMVGAGAQAGASAAGGAATAATAAGVSGAAAGSAANPGTAAGPMNYFIDSLFRRDPANAAPAGGAGSSSSEQSSPDRGHAATAAEVDRIFLNSIRTGALPPDDAKYVAQVISQSTGLAPQDAEKRVSETYAKARAALEEAQTKAKAAADAARKASAYGSLWLFISMLIGAFVASLAATYGGRRRDL